MNKSEAYKIVFDDLTQIELFKGHYDARNGKDSYMHGISTVMEFIASNVSDDCYAEFDDMFIKNMIESEEKAKCVKKTKCPKRKCLVKCLSAIGIMTLTRIVLMKIFSKNTKQ